MNCASCSIPVMVGGASGGIKSKKCTCKDKKCDKKASVKNKMVQEAKHNKPKKQSKKTNNKPK